MSIRERSAEADDRAVHGHWDGDPLLGRGLTQIATIVERSTRYTVLVYPSRRQARADIVEYIEVFYHRRRLHSGLGYRNPREIHNEFLTMQAAAWKAPQSSVRKTRGRSKWLGWWEIRR